MTLARETEREFKIEEDRKCWDIDSSVKIFTPFFWERGKRDFVSFASSLVFHFPHLLITQRLRLRFVEDKSKIILGKRERERILEGKALIEDTDMPVKMQMQAMACASQALDLYYALDCKSIAAHIKKEFDKRYGGGWQCVVGSQFGRFFTHSKGTFIYFTLETLQFLIFKGSSSSPSSLKFG